MTITRRMTRRALVALLICVVQLACRQKPPEVVRPRLGASGWVEETAAQRGYVKAGDVAQFGCPPGWRNVEDTAAALRGKEVSTVYMGWDPPPGGDFVTCVAQAEFALLEPYTKDVGRQTPVRRPLAPVWVDAGVDAVTVGFRSELPLGAAVYFARETPCGPRVIGVRLGDLLNWLVDPQTAPKRDFLGMTSGGCPEQDRRK
jgi:hypothetical protein